MLWRRFRGCVRPAVSTALALAALFASASAAWSANVPIDEEGYYAVTFQVSDLEDRTVKPVSVLSLVEIGSRLFLVIQPHTVPQKALGYIALDRVTAILPVQLGGGTIVEPQRSPAP